MEAILDAILDFGPLECEEKNDTLIFSGVYIIDYTDRIRRVFAFTKKIHEPLFYDK